jgi:hypothetical protein
MKKILLSIALFCFGCYTILFWGAGMHGHIMFRYNMLGDWILSAIVLLCFCIPLYNFIRYVLGRIKKQSTKGLSQKSIFTQKHKENAKSAKFITLILNALRSLRKILCNLCVR